MIIQEISYSNLKNWPQLIYPVDYTIIGLLLIIGFPYTYPLACVQTSPISFVARRKGTSA